MRFTLQITVDNPQKDIKERVMEEVALYLARNGYSFDVGCDPNETDLDMIGKA